MFTQITHSTSMARPNPQQPSPSSPLRKARRNSKRPDADELSERLAPSMVQAQKQFSSSPPKTRRRDLRRPDAHDVDERPAPTMTKLPSSARSSKTPRKSLKRAGAENVSERPARIRKVVQDEEITVPNIAEPTPSHEVAQEVKMTDAHIVESTTPILSDERPARARKVLQEEVSAKPAQHHKVLRDVEMTDTNIAESKAFIFPPTTTSTPTLPYKTSSASTQTATTTTAPTHPSRTTTATPRKIRPVNDTPAYIDFASKVIKALASRHKQRAKCFGHRQNDAILDLLRHASPATREEMLFLTGTEAAQFLAPGAFHNGPILTEGQQPMPLQRIEDFLGEFYDDDSRVFIQDPSVTFAGNSNFVREVTIGAVKKRLLEGKGKGRPWNCLELATHVEDGLRPAFLAGEDCRLLTKVKLEHGGETASRRRYPQGYKEVEKWALLAEAGALTEPHQDSHGYSTYITVNQGDIGFGWLSYPTDEERASWNKDQSVAGDRFRYVVMKPGQTVFFPAGTVHFVFRLPGAEGGHTLAFGGHVLRCSNILHWIKTLIEEKASPNVTNEDLTSSAPGYLGQVEKFVRHAQTNGTMEKWGGAAAVEEFLRLKEAFMAS
jgi:hypothetical protein